MNCIFCGHVGKYEQCEKCLFKGCQKFIDSLKDSSFLLKKDKYHTCKDHNEYVNKYCFHLTCEKCVVGIHLNHYILPICEAVNKIRGNMQMYIEELEVRICIEPSAIDNGPQKQKEYKLLVTRIEEEEQKLQECLTKIKMTLLRNVEALQKTEDVQIMASKDILPSMIQARTNLQSVKDETNTIIFLSRWIKQRFIIDKPKDLQTERTIEEKASLIGRDIKHHFLDLFLRENQQAIFHMLDLLQRLPLSIEQIKNQISPIDPVK